MNKEFNYSEECKGGCGQHPSNCMCKKLTEFNNKLKKKRRVSNKKIKDLYE